MAFWKASICSRAVWTWDLPTWLKYRGPMYDASTPMIAMTTSSSRRVKPRALRLDINGSGGFRACEHVCRTDPSCEASHVKGPMAWGRCSRGLGVPAVASDGPTRTERFGIAVRELHLHSHSVLDAQRRFVKLESRPITVGQMCMRDGGRSSPANLRGCRAIMHAPLACSSCGKLRRHPFEGVWRQRGCVGRRRRNRLPKNRIATTHSRLNRAIDSDGLPVWVLLPA